MLRWSTRKIQAGLHLKYKRYFELNLSLDRSLGMREYPFVTAMIVARNEEKYIERCLRSLLDQSYPPDRYEVLIIDSLSDDRTISIAKEVEQRFNTRETIDGKNEVRVQVRYLTNPKKLLAAGWNIGIKEAKGEYVVRIDAHGYADKDFILKSVETILTVKDAVCVGGSMKTEAISEKGKIIASVLSSPFGVGNSKFRYSDRAQYVDTVAFGLYRKSIFAKVGYFDETLARNQDNDMHRRIRETGGKFYLNPEIKSTYHPRETVMSMMKQGFNNGKWNIITFKKDPKSLSVRHLVPLFFVLGIIGSLILGVINPLFWMVLLSVLIAHGVLGFLFAIKKSRRLKQALYMPLLFLALHLSYGIGSLMSILISEVKSKIVCKMPR
jgi:glycosyltransferase involved in cell wall biosynthesis